MNNINPIYLTIGTVLVTNILTNIATRIPWLFAGIDNTMLNVLAGCLVSAVICAVAAWLHSKNISTQVAKATGTGDGGKP